MASEQIKVAEMPEAMGEEQIVKCLVEASCIGVVKMSYDAGPYQITRPSINADKFARALIAARDAQWQSTRLRGGVPVAWWIPKAEQFCLAKPDGSRPFASAWQPLYTAAPQAPAAEVDADGEAFRTAARLGLTLRFHGGCAQSGMPGSPSAYEVVTGADPASSMRQAVRQAAAVIEAGGEPQRLNTGPALDAGVVRNQCDGCCAGQPLDADGHFHRDKNGKVTMICQVNRYAAMSAQAGKGGAA